MKANMYKNASFDERKFKTKVVETYIAQNEKRITSTCEYQHHVHTPWALCGDMLDKIPNISEKESFLVLFNVEFLYELSKKIDMSNKVVYYYTTNNFMTLLAKKIHVNIVVINTLETDMKFDVVIGNPPYQDSEAKSSKKMWPKFVDTAFTFTQESGFVAMITPSSWTSGKNGIFDYFKRYQCHYVCFDGTEWFPTVGTTVSYYVIQKIFHNGASLSKEGYQIDFSHHDSLPVRPSALTMSIIDKLYSFPSIGIKVSSMHHSQRIDKVSRIKDETFKYPNKHTATQVLWSINPHEIGLTKKVLFPLSSAMKAEYDDSTYGITEHYAYIPVEDQHHGENCVKYLHSKIISWLRVITSTHAAWDKTVLRNIPTIPLDRDMSDNDLYEYFNLTNEEISLVESTIK